MLLFIIYLFIRLYQTHTGPWNSERQRDRQTETNKQNKRKDMQAK